MGTAELTAHRFAASPTALHERGASRHEGLVLRPIGPADAGAAAGIVFEAFARIHDRHVFPRDFPTLEAAAELVGAFTAHPGIWGVVAERDGSVVGSNFVDERGPVRGVGPITVAPGEQARGVGRRLMAAALERSAGARGVRLLQDAFNTGSLALYASLGFEVSDPVVVMGGRPRPARAGVGVRRLEARDVPGCEALSIRVLGYERTRELQDALGSPVLEPFVAERNGRIVAYTAGVSFFPAAHGVGETEADMANLILGALSATGAAASFLLPTRQPELFRACLAAGLQVVKPMNYMTVGERTDPHGAWFPSVLY